MLPTEPPASDSGFRALLKNRPFLTLWSGQILSQVADKIFFILLIALIETNDYHSPHAFRNSTRSLVMIAFTLPAIFFGSAAGIFVDRFAKKQILTASNLIRGLLTAILPWLPKQFLLLLVITFSISTVTQFFAPAEQAAIPLLVKRQNLMSANALFTTTMLSALIVGFAVGEPLLSLARGWIGDYGQATVVGGLYLLAAGVIQLIPLKETLSADSLVAISPWRDFKVGLSYLRQNRLVSNAMLQLTVLYSVFAALTVLAIELADKIGLKPTQFGFLLAASGIGMVMGAATLGGRWGEHLHQKPLPLIGFLSMGFVLGVFVFAKTLWLGLALSILLGLGASLIGVPMQTLIQQQTPESMRGKVFGFQNNVINIALSLPLAITGPLTDAIGLRSVLFGMSVVVCLVGVWAWNNTRRDLQDVS